MSYRLRFFLDFRITWASTGRPALFSFTRMGMNFPAGSLKLFAGFFFRFEFRFLAITSSSWCCGWLLLVWPSCLAVASGEM
jgi:hypothetical protein